MRTYEEEMDGIREAISLGFSISLIIKEMEFDPDTNIKALNEIKGER